MRSIIYGVGAIGGMVGAALSLAGHEVAFVARPRQLERLRDRGLRFKTPAGEHTVHVEVVDRVAQLRPTADDVVLLTVKSQHTAAALADLAATGERPAVVCVQNGVNNERLALRHFADVYGMFISSPATHLEEGVIRAHSHPTLGVFDIGRYPSGVDGRAEQIAANFNASGFSSLAVPNIQDWKYRKLLGNLRNALDAACGREAMRSALGQVVVDEAEECLKVAGIPSVSNAQAADRQGDLVSFQPVGGEPHRGGSLWQSLERGSGSVEVDYLNGEIVLLGRLHGVPTPANELMVDVVNRINRGEAAPRSYTVEELAARLGSPVPEVPGRGAAEAPARVSPEAELSGPNAPPGVRSRAEHDRSGRTE